MEKALLWFVLVSGGVRNVLRKMPHPPFTVTPVEKEEEFKTRRRRRRRRSKTSSIYHHSNISLSYFLAFTSRHTKKKIRSNLTNIIHVFWRPQFTSLRSKCHGELFEASISDDYIVNLLFEVIVNNSRLPINITK